MAKKKQPSEAFASVPDKYWIGISLLLTFVAYIPVFSNGFVNWDDPDYVLNNPYIKDLSNLKGILFEPVQGNYHPLTMLSLALNYAIGGLDPLLYHLLNLVIHLANVVLVFFFIRALLEGKPVIAFITALLFGIHPMHVESVAWVTERKDVLYTFFFLLGLISYIRYARLSQWKDLGMTLLWFALSILSKPAAIVFPAILLTIDFFLKRRINARLIIEKIPFLLIALVFVWLTMSEQSAVGATDVKGNFRLDQQVFFGFYGLVMYIVKLFLPVNLSAFYPFPPVNETLPILYYISPLIVLGIAGLGIWSMKKTNVYAFGLLFYLINLILVIQFYIVGSAIIAERYTYVPYIGLFFIIGYWIDKIMTRDPGWKPFIVGAFSVVALTLTFMSYSRAAKWKDDITLWEDAIGAQPSSRALSNLARKYKELGDREKAMKYYNEAIRLNIADAESILNRGNLYFDAGQLDLALADYNAVLKLNPSSARTLVNRGSLFARQRKFEEALQDFNSAQRIDPSFDQIYFNRGLTYQEMNKPEEAMADFNKYLETNPEDAGIMNSVGLCQVGLNDFTGAVATYSKAISLEENAVFFLNRSFAYYKLNDFKKGLDDALRAEALGAKLNPAFVETLRKNAGSE